MRMEASFKCNVAHKNLKFLPNSFCKYLNTIL